MKTKTPQHLPGKKVFAVAFFAVGILTWVVISKNTGVFEHVTSTLTSDALHVVAHAEEIFPDEDQDGLYDWEEGLYKTDAHNFDSDRDGVSDGDEYTSSKKVAQLSVSDSVYVAINKLGEELQNTPDPLASLSLEPVIYDDRFTASDVHIVEISTTTRLLYVSKALSILNKRVDNDKNEAFEIIDHWLLTYKDDDLARLKEISAGNMQMSEELMKLEVPSDLIDTHLLLANSLYHASLALLDIEKTTLDPTAGFFAAANYANYESKFTRAIVELTIYIDALQHE